MVELGQQQQLDVAPRLASYGTDLVSKIEAFLRQSTEPLPPPSAAKNDSPSASLSISKDSAPATAIELRPSTATGADWEQIQRVHDVTFKHCHVPLLERQGQGESAKAWFEPAGKCIVAEQHRAAAAGAKQESRPIIGFIFFGTGNGKKQEIGAATRTGKLSFATCNVQLLSQPLLGFVRGLKRKCHML